MELQHLNRSRPLPVPVPYTVEQPPNLQRSVSSDGGQQAEQLAVFGPPLPSFNANAETPLAATERSSQQNVMDVQDVDNNNPSEPLIQQSLNTQASRGRSASTSEHRFHANVQKQYICVIYWTFMLLAEVFLSYYFYEVLVAQEPRLGKSLPNASDTNLIIAILAQIFGGLMLSLYYSLNNALQVQMLSRPRGASLLEAMQLCRSTGLIGTLRMAFICGRHQAWSLQRYLIHKFLGSSY
jgi:hypothetical protein